MVCLLAHLRLHSLTSFFAYDSFLFRRADMEGTTVLKSVISIYETSSSQKVSFCKSFMFFFKSVEEESERV